MGEDYPGGPHQDRVKFLRACDLRVRGEFYRPNFRRSKWTERAERSLQSNVRFGSKADIGAPWINVRFTPKSGH